MINSITQGVFVLLYLCQQVIHGITSGVIIVTQNP